MSIMVGLAHIGIYTADPEKCAKFYVENLGFRRYHEKQMGPEMKICFVELGGCVIEFVGGHQDGIPDGTVDHICLNVQGIDELVADLKAKGVEFENDGNVGYLAALFPTPVKNAFFRGPAGERIELFDYTAK